ERHPGDSKNYNECIRHETMRVAVCDMLEGKVPCPEALWCIFYVPLALHTEPSTLCHRDIDPFGEKRGRFDYQGLLARLSATHRRIREKSLAEVDHNDDDSDSDTSSSGTDPDSQGSSHP
ncbi:ubiquitin-conjugating enzyme E2 Z, partial [Lates japonicus]